MSFIDGHRIATGFMSFAPEAMVPQKPTDNHEEKLVFNG